MAFNDHLWQSVADLSSLLLSEESLDTTLQRVADLTVRTIPRCDAVGVTLMSNGDLSTHAATGGLVYEVDHYQYDIDQGPCLQAVRDREAFEIDDMDTDERWPGFSRHAAQRGIHCSMSLPLVARGETLGALNLYSRTPRAFNDADREMALIFAAQAALALANTQTYSASVALAQQLREAVSSRAVIEQAKGIIMAQRCCEDDEAFAVLTAASQNANIKIRVLAQRIVRAAQRGENLPIP